MNNWEDFMVKMCVDDYNKTKRKRKLKTCLVVSSVIILVIISIVIFL